MKRLLSLLSVFLLAACANPYKEYYTSNTNNLTQEQKQNLIFLKEGQEPILIKTDNPQEALYDAMAKGYFIVGTSGFVGPLNDASFIIDQAKDVKATHALYHIEFSDTRSGTTSIALPDYSVTTSQGSVSSPYGGYANYYGTSTTTGTKYVPMTYHVDRYNQSAAFLVKDKKIYRFGMKITDLTQEERVEIGQNTGAFIAVVFYDSPAFKANIMQNDILLKIDNIKIINGNHALEVMSSIPIMTKKVIFTILRKGKNINVPVLLEDERLQQKNNIEQEQIKQTAIEENKDNPILKFFNSLIDKK